MITEYPLAFTGTERLSEVSLGACKGPHDARRTGQWAFLYSETVIGNNEVATLIALRKGVLIRDKNPGKSRGFYL
ncbi:uncharacterized protein METZ01_LOCUS294247 [marine metagenome]|uniref:Uncharacterized protein n=1 Tax=marine metagenome TaxID=408172 RepID=A0A382LXZ1_9ZZZZ